MNAKSNNLDTYRILFLVKGILTLLFSLLPLIYVFIGIFIGNTEEFNETDFPESFNPGIIFVIIGGVGFIILVTLGIMNLFVSKYLKERRNYNFIFVISIINCITGILGILLCVFTLIELNKPEVKALFYKEE